MQNRTKRGNTLTLVVTGALFVVVIGLGIDFLLMIFREHRLLSHRSDSIALGMARDILISVDIPLEGSFEEEVFGKLAKQPNKRIDLVTFNKLIGKSLLIAANAAAIGTTEAVNHANQVIAQVEGLTPHQGQASIGLRLTKELDEAAADYSSGGDLLGMDPAMRSIFEQAIASGKGSGKGTKTGLSAGFSVGKAPKKGVKATDGTPGGDKAAILAAQKFVAWVYKESSSNLEYDDGVMPVISTDPDNIVDSQIVKLDSGVMVTDGGRRFLMGYKELKPVGGAASGINPLMAVPITTGQPHLVSAKDFEEWTDKTKLSPTIMVPPNAYKFIASGLDATTNQMTIMSSHAVVGNGQPYLPGMDDTYIEIVNQGDIAYYNYNGEPTNTENVYAKELMSGIYLANNNAFSTDQAAIKAWADYNTGKSTTKPPETGPDGNPLVHGNAEAITGAKAPSSGHRGSGPCLWLHVEHGDPDYYDPECGNMMPQFKAGYPDGDSTPGSPAKYMATEQFKQGIRKSFNVCGDFSCPRDSTGLALYTTEYNLSGFDNKDPVSGQPLTGAAARSVPNPAKSGASSKVSKPGSLRELLTQVDPNATETVLKQMRQRMRQMNPKATANDINNILDDTNVRFDLGDIKFIWYDSESKRYIFGSAPPFVKGDPFNPKDSLRRPDGKSQVYRSVYQSIATLVNPHREGGIHFQLYTSYPDPTAVGLAEDQAVFTPSTGANGLLARLQFTNKCNGVKPPGGGGSLAAAGGNFCQPD